MSDVTHYRWMLVLSVVMVGIMARKALDGVSDPIWETVMHFTAVLMGCGWMIYYHNKGVDWHGEEEDRD